MKRKLSILLAFAIVCCMSGCGVTPANSNNTTPSSQTSSSETVSESSTSSEEVAQIHKPGETVKLGNWEITVNSAEAVDKIDGNYNTAFKPSEGNKYVVINTTVKNVDTNSDTFLPSISMSKDVKVKVHYGEYEFSSTSLLAHNDDLHDTTLNPLSSKTGIIVFSVVSNIAVPENLNVTFSMGKEAVNFSLV